MISKTAKYLCKDPLEMVENYYAAVSDKTHVWDLHHRKEISEGKSKKQLLEEDLYYKQPAADLIFLTRSEHCKLHRPHHNKKRWHHTEEAKKRIGEAASMRTGYASARIRIDIWDKKDKVLSMLNRGLSIRKVAKVLNCSRTVVSNIAKSIKH